VSRSTATLHFKSVFEAERWIRKNRESWLFTTEMQLCGRCWALRTRAQEGRAWGEWCDSASDARSVWRYCDRYSRPDYTVRSS